MTVLLFYYISSTNHCICHIFFKRKNKTFELFVPVYFFVGGDDYWDDESVCQSHQPRGVPAPHRGTAGDRPLLYGLVLCVSFSTKYTVVTEWNTVNFVQQYSHLLSSLWWYFVSFKRLQKEKWLNCKDDFRIFFWGGGEETLCNNCDFHLHCH